MIQPKELLLKPLMLLGIFLLVGDSLADDKDVPKLNKAILKFAEDQLDKQVGNGECWTHR
jgi:hypothetical protein